MFPHLFSEVSLRAAKVWAKLAQGISLISNNGRIGRGDLPTPLEKSHAHHSPEYDQSYEDALLEAHLRRFFNSEYGKIEPPAGSFQTVRITIRQHEELQSRTQHRQVALSSILTRYAIFLRKALSGSLLARSMPTGIALMLMLVLMSPVVSQIINGKEYGLQRDTFTPLITSSQATASVQRLSSEEPRTFALYDPSYDPPDTWAPPEAMLKYRLGLDISSDMELEYYKSTIEGPE